MEASTVSTFLSFSLSFTLGTTPFFSSHHHVCCHSILIVYRTCSADKMIISALTSILKKRPHHTIAHVYWTFNVVLTYSYFTYWYNYFMYFSNAIKWNKQAQLMLLIHIKETLVVLPSHTFILSFFIPLPFLMLTFYSIILQPVCCTGHIITSINSV